MDAPSQADFISNYLAPAMIAANIKTKVYVYDHNWDRTDYPETVLQKMTAVGKEVLGGVAFHCYLGNVTAQSDFHSKYPDQDLLITECSGFYSNSSWTDDFMWDMINIFIGGANNWASGTIKWNLVLDQNMGPKNGGCQNCRGLVTIHTD